MFVFVCLTFFFNSNFKKLKKSNFKNLKLEKMKRSGTTRQQQTHAGLATTVAVTAMIALATLMTPADAKSSIFNKRWWNPNTKYAPIFYGNQYFNISELVEVNKIPGYIAALGDFNNDRL